MPARPKFLSKLITPPKRDVRRELSVNTFQLALHKERDRADRREIPFSLLIIRSLKLRLDGQLEQVLPVLFDRLRLTDEAAILSEGVIGVLLPDTESEPASKVGREIREDLSAVLDDIKLEIYTYPFDDDPSNEDRGIGLDSGIREPIDSLAEKETAQPLSFALRIPAWKRSLDILLSVVGLLILSPFMLITAAVIKLTSRGPVFFTQWREGHGGRKFKIYKFRTMQLNAEALQSELRKFSEQDGPAFKMKDDPRLTWYGGILRKSCFDETPQLFNILRGDMTLVGPRPLPVNESLACTRWQRRRLDVTPGMTCIWQVYGDRHVSFDQWMRMDAEYIRTAGMWTDVKLLLRTLVFVFLRRASV